MADLNTTYNDNVAIAMATYNGEKYLAAQIDSILSQSFSNWVLFIHDDGSKDNTRAIISRYTESYPDKIRLIEDGAFSGHGSMLNFFGILQWIRDHENCFSYFMLCDQDDYWLPNKILEEVMTIKRIEQSGEAAAAVHSDVKITDEKLSVLYDSFYAYAGLEPTKYTLSSLIMDNVFIGCTMLWNRRLNDLLDLSPEHALMHDWWIGLSASAVGEVEYIPSALMYYRQHGNNVVGAKEKAYSLAYFKDKISSIQRLQANYSDCFQQGYNLLNSYGQLMNENARQLLSAVSKIPSMPKLQRVQTVCTYKIFRQKMVSRFAEILLI